MSFADVRRALEVDILAVAIEQHVEQHLDLRGRDSSAPRYFSPPDAMRRAVSTPSSHVHVTNSAMCAHNQSRVALVAGSAALAPRRPLDNEHVQPLDAVLQQAAEDSSTGAATLILCVIRREGVVEDLALLAWNAIVRNSRTTQKRATISGVCAAGTDLWGGAECQRMCSSQNENV